MFELPFVFEALVPADACKRCFDTGIWLTPRNAVEPCPNRQLIKGHAAPNFAALVIRHAFSVKTYWLNSSAFDLARILTNFSESQPCPFYLIFPYLFEGTNLTESEQSAKFVDLVDELRKWRVPVAMSDCGCWIEVPKQ